MKKLLTFALIFAAGCSQPAPVQPPKPYEKYVPIAVAVLDRLVTCIDQANGDFKKIKPCLNTKPAPVTK